MKIIETFLARPHGGLIPLIALLGPTASGKTALSLSIAKQFNGEIISADSRQVYRRMNIGTDKIPLEKREGITHHLIDVAEPEERFTVVDFKRLADGAVRDIAARGKVPMLVGGTGLYLRAVTENFFFPPESSKLRMRLEAELREKGAEALHKRLSALDPESAAKISPRNLPYLLRALEIVELTGKPKSAQKKPSPYAVLKIGISRPREELFSRIELRVDEQVQNGLVEETRALLGRYPAALASMQSLGYKEIGQYVTAKISLNEAVALLKKNTRNFAKRQLAWWKREPDIIWQPGIR